MKNAVLYLRSSKDRSDVSIDAQRRQLLELANTRDIKVVEEYADAVESGKDDNRPAFQSLLRNIRNPSRGWDLILALDTARIARGRHLAIIFEEQECKRNGIKIIYKSLPDSDPITEMLLKSILQAMDEWHSMTSKAKGLSGMSENIKQGYRAGGKPPKGYKLESIATGAIRDGSPVTKSRLAVNDDALLVRAYLQKRASGLSRASALANLNVDWPVTTLLSIEHNALTYAGHTVWNRHAEKANGGGYVGGNKYKPKSEWVINRNTHEPLINEAEAEFILSQVETRKIERTKKSSSTYMLTGLLKSTDGVCWHASGDGAYRLGKGKRIPAESIDNAVLESIKKDITSNTFATAVLEHYKLKSKPTNNENNLSKLNLKLKELDNKAHGLAELLIETTAKATLMRSIERIESERDEIHQKIIDYAEIEENKKVMKSLTLTNVKTMLNNITDQLEIEDTNLLKDALTSIIDVVILDETSLQATVMYKVANITGDKLASPRGFEPRSPP